MAASIPLGPPALGLALDTDAAVDDDGWLTRTLRVPTGLDGPPGILQGGFAATLPAAIARTVDRFGAPTTSVQTRLSAPTRLGSSVAARVRADEGVARYLVELRDADRLLLSAEVELAGHDPAPPVADLLELATVPLPTPVPQTQFPTCFVCGPRSTHPLALHLDPAAAGPGTVVLGWVPDAALAEDGWLSSLVVAAALDCPSVWAAAGHLRARGQEGALLAGYRFQPYRPPPVEEPLRVVARCDEVDGRKIRARAALVDEDGTLYALASALHLAVDQVPDWS